MVDFMVGSIVFSIHDPTMVLVAQHYSSLSASSFGLGIKPPTNPSFF